MASAHACRRWVAARSSRRAAPRAARVSPLKPRPLTLPPAPAGVRPSRRSLLLTGQGAFDTVFRGGRRIEGRYLQLVAMPAQGTPGRVGYVIGKKALPRAVDRNRIRRQLREIVRAHRPAVQAFDLILRIKAAPKPLDHHAVSGEAPRLLATLFAAA